MARVSSSVTHKKRVKKVLKQSKGYFGKRKNIYSIAKQSVVRSGMFSFAHRRKKKGDFRRMWQTKINAAVRQYDATMSYSKFIHLLIKNNILLNRKSLAFLAVHDYDGFCKIVDKVKES